MLPRRPRRDSETAPRIRLCPELRRSRPSTTTWAYVIDARLDRARARGEQSGAFDLTLVERVRAAATLCRRELERVEPTPSLEDATTKNVLVDDGRRSGIVDFDWIAAGDALMNVALTRVSLLARGSDASVYVDALIRALGFGRPARLALYEAVFAVDLLAEMGTRFNRDEPAAVDPAQEPARNDCRRRARGASCLERLSDPEHVSVRVAEADLEHPPRSLDRLVKDVGAATSELRVERADVVGPQVDVEQVGRHELRVRRGARAAVEEDRAAVAHCRPVVLRRVLIRLDVEPEHVAVVRKRRADVGNEEERRMTRQHAH